MSNNVIRFFNNTPDVRLAEARVGYNLDQLSDLQAHCEVLASVAHTLYDFIRLTPNAEDATAEIKRNLEFARENLVEVMQEMGWLE